MKLLINMCSHDGIVSYYNGVGTMTKRYIKTISKILDELDYEYELNLFTPEYFEDSFGYNEETKLKNANIKNTKIYMINNGSNGKINFGTISEWKLLCKNTAKIINDIDYSLYDKVITIYNDTPFANLGKYLKLSDNHKAILILHSTIKLHKVDSAIENSERFYDTRLKWETEAIDYINKTKNVYAGVIGDFITKHLIEEYNLNKNKTIKIYNGELGEYKKRNFSKESRELLNKINSNEDVIISFGRAEEYKNLDKVFILGKELGIKSMLIAQLYYDNQPIKYKYIKCAKKYDGILYLNPPFDYSANFLNDYKGRIICLIPSKIEIMGLIINEVRRLNKDDILIVANDVNGLNEQITDQYDGLLVDLNNIKESANKIKKFFEGNFMKMFNENSQRTLAHKYNIEKNMKNFLEKIMEE